MKIKSSFSSWFKTLGEKLRDFFKNLWASPNFRKILIIVGSVIAGIILLPLLIQLLTLPFKLIGNSKTYKYKEHKNSGYKKPSYKDYKYKRYRE